MSGRDLHGGNLKAGTSEPRTRYKAIPGSTIAENDVVQCLSRVGDTMVMTKADRDAIQTARGQLYIARHAVLATNGNDPILTVVNHKLVTDVDTSAAQVVGAPVFLSSTAGGWSLTPPTTGFVRRIGQVTEISATTGAWEFEGGSGSGVVAGVIEIANGVSTGTLSVGSALDGCPVVACLNETDGTVHVVSAVISGGTLTVTLSANTTAARYCAVAVFGG